MGGAGACGDSLGFKLNAMVGIIGETKLVFITMGGGMLVLGNAGGGIARLGSAIGCSKAGRTFGGCESLVLLATGSCNGIVAVEEAGLDSSGGGPVGGGARIFGGCDERALSLGKSNGIVKSSVLVL